MLNYVVNIQKARAWEDGNARWPHDVSTPINMYHDTLEHALKTPVSRDRRYAFHRNATRPLYALYHTRHPNAIHVRMGPTACRWGYTEVVMDDSPQIILIKFKFE